MVFPLVFVLVVLVPDSILGKCDDSKDDLTYEDLLQTNVTCAFSENCFVNESNPDPYRRCSCDEDCSVNGTCCIDSPHRGTSNQMVECRNVDLTLSKTNGYFLVSRCPTAIGSEFVWKDLCEKEWNGEDDMMMLAPVSSLETNITYKNYYCFRCHEDGDQFLNWDINIMSDSFVDKTRISEDFTLSYNKEKQRWIATTGDDYVLKDILLTFWVPKGVTVSSCHVVLVSDCHDDWTDEDIREKCRSSYAAIVYDIYNTSVSYKNPHCALCNFEEVENISCGNTILGSSFGTKPKFSFSHLLNIHREDTDKKETKRCEDNQLWDPYGKKCRRIACAIPGYIVKEGRCTSP